MPLSFVTQDSVCLADGLELFLGTRILVDVRMKLLAELFDLAP